MLPEGFIDELQIAQTNLNNTGFWEKHFGATERTSFRQTLNLYSQYHSELNADQKAQLAEVFWLRIQSRKLPIIEMSADGENAQVFFLFRQAKDNGKDLYLQGDVHGYGSTLDSQRLQRQGETDILCCENSILKNALVTYQYAEVADNPDHPVYRNRMPNDEQLTGVLANSFPDPYQKHAHPYYAAGFFCVNADNDVSHLGSSPVDWSTRISGTQMHLVSGKGGAVSPFPYEVSDDYMGQLWGPDCAEFRRVIHVFAPPGKLDQLVIINDGPGYLLVNTAERIAKLKQEGTISEQCAVVFVGALPGLEKDHTLTSELSKMQGMGIRTIDYLDHVDEYVEFLTGQLLPHLEDEGIELPHDPTKVTVIGSSMSGTASLYMGLRYPEHFGNVIAQSPSPANRQLIENLDHLSERARRINIDLSCGAFEDATQYAKIGNLEFMRSLEAPLGVTGHTGLHGHELPAWSLDLERSMPAIYRSSQLVNARLKTLDARLLSTENATEKQKVLERFWKTIESNPLMEEQSDGRYCLTFVYRNVGEEDIHSLELLGAICDPSMQERGQLQRMPGTDVWHLTIDNIAAYARITYQYYKNDRPIMDPLNTLKIDSLHQENGDQYIAELPCANEQPHVHREQLPALMNTLRSEGHLLTKSITPGEFSVRDILNYQIHLPPDYNPNRNPPYKVLIHLDGAETIESMKMPAIMDRAMRDGTLAPTISIYIDAAHRPIAYGCGAEAERYADFLAKEFMPKLQAEYPSMSRLPQDTTIAGFSMGGHGAVHIATRHPEVFGNAIGQSSSFWMGNETAENQGLLEKLQQQSFPNNEAARRLCVYLNVGDLETAAFNGVGHDVANQHVVDFLQQQGVRCVFEHYSGDHCFAEWQERLVDGLVQLHKLNKTYSAQDATDMTPSHSLSEELGKLPTTESGAIDLTQAKRIAEGGTHVLYRFPDAPFVVKVMKQNPKPDELEALERKYAILYDCFDKDGKQRCIREQHVTLPVLLPGKEPESAALSIVPYEQCFDSKVKFDFKIDPAELDPYLMDHHVELFDNINENLINGNAESHFDIAHYTTMDARIGAILQRLDSDAELRVVMIEFLNHYRDFYQQTNIILDALGWENILFFKDDHDAWQFKIGSAIKHDTGAYTNQLFANIHAGKAVDLSEFVNMTHAYFSPANIRAVNVCAMKLGLDPIIHDVAIDPQDLLTVSQRLSIPQRMLAYARHGDFENVESMLEKNKSQLSLTLSDSWVYPQIAYEYIHHGQAPSALNNYLDTVNAFPVVLPEKIDDQKWVKNSKIAIVDLQNTYDNKAMLHTELTAWVAAKVGAQPIVNREHSQIQPITSNRRRDFVHRASSSTSTQMDYPRALQNNMVSPPVIAVNKAQGSTATSVTHHSLRDSIVIVPANSNRMDSQNQ